MQPFKLNMDCLNTPSKSKPNAEYSTASSMKMGLPLFELDKQITVLPETQL